MPIEQLNLMMCFGHLRALEELVGIDRFVSELCGASHVICDNGSGAVGTIPIPRSK